MAAARVVKARQKSADTSEDFVGIAWDDVFRRLCRIAHKAGIQVLMHSCGYNWAILDDLAEVGINAFQFDQTEIYGIEQLAAK